MQNLSKEDYVLKEYNHEEKSTIVLVTNTKAVTTATSVTAQ